jgi:hypothetical protein
VAFAVKDSRARAGPRGAILAGIFQKHDRTEGFLECLAIGVFCLTRHADVLAPPGHAVITGPPKILQRLRGTSLDARAGPECNAEIEATVCTPQLTRSLIQSNDLCARNIELVGLFYNHAQRIACTCRTAGASDLIKDSGPNECFALGSGL